MNRAQFSEVLSLDVSRETWDNLCIYAELLKKWQKKINLVSPKTIDALWERHMLDSAQVLPLIGGRSGSVLDIGSGAGFPGLVLSIMGVSDIYLVESDGRKCSFLREVIRQCRLSATVIQGRIESVEVDKPQFILARALSSLDRLLFYADRFVLDDTVCLFLKGRSADLEISEASCNWLFSIEKHKSITENDAQILEIFNVRRR